jgi:hypothetical protein
MERSGSQLKRATNPSRSLFVDYQSFTYEGDLIIGGNETRTIENCEYGLIGNIIVKDDATLIVRNAIFNQTGKDVFVSILVENRASFYLTNATLRITENVSFPYNLRGNITILDEAKMYITKSNIENPDYGVDISARDNSLIYVENSIMRRTHEDVMMDRYVIVSYDYSQVRIKNSTLDRVVTWESSKVVIERVTLNDTIRVFGESTVQVSDSTIKYVTADNSPSLSIRSSIIRSFPYIRTGENSDVLLLHMAVKEVWANNSAKIRLIDTSVEALHIFGNATVLVGWDLPFFGPVAFPPAVALAIHLIAFILLGAIIAIISFVLIKKLRRRSLSRARENKTP